MTIALAGPAFAQDAFRFGLAMPLTGSQALYGQDQVKAAEWAVAEINKAGGINGKKLEMTVLDTQADPQLGIQMANRLVSVEKVPVFVTAWSAVVKAVAPVANDNRVVELSVGANSPDIAKLGDYVYTTFPLGRHRYHGGRQVCRDQHGQEKGRDRLHQQRNRHRRGGSLQKVFTEAGGQVGRLRDLRSEGDRFHRPAAQGPRRQSGHHSSAGACLGYPAGDCPDATAWPRPADQLVFSGL